MTQNPFNEGLLAGSLVRVFGRLFRGLMLPPQNERRSKNEEVDAPKVTYPDDQVESVVSGPTANDTDDKHQARQLARIYGFSFEGHYYRLTPPAIFVVVGPGFRMPSNFGDPTAIWSSPSSALSSRTKFL